jgi:neutral ceramidase
MTHDLRIGNAAVDITPATPGPLAGMHEAQRAEGVHEPLAVRAFVVDDGVQVAAIVAVDVLWVHGDTVTRVRERMADAAGLHRPCAVMVACTHTHSAPHTTFFAGVPADRAFVARLEDAIVQAVLEALADRRPAALRAATVATEACTFNRRPIYRNGQVGTHGPAWVEDFVRFEGPADEDLQVLVAVDGREDAIGGLVAFACHPTLTGFDGVYSADYPGALVAELRARHGAPFAFLQGASANLAPSDPRDPNADARGIAAAERLGRRLAAVASLALPVARTVVVPPGSVRQQTTRVAVRQREVTPDHVAAARAFLSAPPDRDATDGADRRFYRFDHTFYRHSPAVEEWFAREMIGMWEWQQRAAGGPIVEKLEVQAIALGDVAVVGLPVELFTELGQQLKDTSPFATTIIATQANGWHGYVPTAEAFERGGYEPRLGYQSRLVPEAGELLVAAASELLVELGAREPHPARSAPVS